jgi:hypothetical protein
VLPDGTARSGHSAPLDVCAPSGGGAAPADVARAQEAGASAPLGADANPEAASSSGVSLSLYDGPPLSGGALWDIAMNNLLLKNSRTCAQFCSCWTSFPRAFPAAAAQKDWRATD